VVLEPSAGTGLLAILAQLHGGNLELNELAEPRAGLLERLFPRVAVTRFDAVRIDDHLAKDLRPSVVIMNPPFSVMAHVEGRAPDATYRHIRSALARLETGGRLVAITGAGFAPEQPAWRDAFVRLQQEARVVFTAAIDGSAFASHGTSIETRLTVFDKVAADDATQFPGSAGLAPDVATLLQWVMRDVPPREAIATATELIGSVQRSRSQHTPDLAAQHIARTTAQPARSLSGPDVPAAVRPPFRFAPPDGVPLAYETCDGCPPATPASARRSTSPTPCRLS
jgi:hypothetical protein